MTGTELFNLTTGVMGIPSANATSYVDTIIPQINMILAQTFNLENNNRAYIGTAVLATIPSITALSETLTYQDNVLRNVVVWGLAQLLALSDDDTIKSGFFESRYADNYRLESKFIASDIINYYDLEV